MAAILSEGVKKIEGLFVHEINGDNGEEIELKKGASATARIENVYNVVKSAEYTVTKIWNDDDNRDGVRPGVLTVNLKADGKTVDTVDLTASESWTHNWTGLPVASEDAEMIECSVEEALPSDYTQEEKTVAEGSTTFKNKHDPELYDKTGELTVIKVWDDDDNLLNSRPLDGITVELWGNDSKIATAVLKENADGIWAHTFEGLYLNEGGEPIENEIKEVSVFGYDTTYSRDENGNFVVSNTMTDPCLFGGCGQGEEEPPITPDTGFLTRNGNEGTSQNSMMTVVLGGVGLTVLMAFGVLKKRTKTDRRA